MKVLLVIVLLIPSLVFSYTVVRKDGRSFSGDLVTENDQNIVLEDETGITVKFRKDQLDLEKTKQANTTTQKKEEQLDQEVEITTVEKKQETGWTGERISVDFKDVDLRDFFMFIAEISGMNMILDPAVKGTLTIKLTDVPWDQAMDLVCRQYGLGYEIDGKVYSVK